MTSQSGAQTLAKNGFALEEREKTYGVVTATNGPQIRNRGEEQRRGQERRGEESREQRRGERCESIEMKRLRETTDAHR